MGKPLVRFWEGQESPTVWTRYCGTAAKAGGKRRRRTSSCSGGRLLPTRSEVYRARDTKRQLDAVARLLRASPVGRDLRCGHRVRENAVRRRPPGVAADDQAPVVPLCGRLSILLARRE